MGHVCMIIALGHMRKSGRKRATHREYSTALIMDITQVWSGYLFSGGRKGRTGPFGDGAVHALRAAAEHAADACNG